jgi:hypothetical protein
MEAAALRVEGLGHRAVRATTAAVERLIFASPAAAGHRSLVRKRLRPLTSAPDVPDMPQLFAGWREVTHWSHWHREVDVYASGFLDGLDAGFRAPRCVAIEDDTESASLWLEDVRGAPAREWSVPRFALAMRGLGRLQARFAGVALPAFPWWCRDYLRACVPQTQQREVEPRAWRLANERGRLLARLESSPQTFCHNDLWTGNMFSQSEPENDDGTIVIDWASAGYGPLAFDVANAVHDSVWMGGLDAALLDDLRAASIDAYVAGLREGGYRGDEARVRENYALAAALRFGLLGHRAQRARDPVRRAARAAVCERALAGALPLLRDGSL